MPSLDLDTLLRCLLRPASDPGLAAIFGADRLSGMPRSEHYGALEFRAEGVDVVFNEAAFVPQLPEVTDPRQLYLVAIHLHRRKHEGYEAYTHPLPGGIAFGDDEAGLRDRLGEPLRSGGGGMSAVLKRPIPRWLLFPASPVWGNAELHCQLDASGHLELVTISPAQAAPEKP